MMSPIRKYQGPKEGVYTIITDPQRVYIGSDGLIDILNKEVRIFSFLLIFEIN
jgi:hypothetical protein